MATTYVLAGHDHNGAFTNGLAALEGQEGVVILRPQPGQSVADTIKAAGIAAGDSLVVASHGMQGGIEWEKGQGVSYDAIFKTLPEGVTNIAVTSCFGGSAQDSLASVPKGTMLQTLVGSETVNIGSAITQFSREGTKLGPIDTLLEALDNVDADQVAAVATRENTASTTTKLVSDPSKVLPHIVGIGGQPPIRIDLNEKIAEMGRAGDNGTLDRNALGAAIDKVYARFDTDRDGREYQMTGFSWSEFKVLGQDASVSVNGGEKAEAALRENIQGVAIKLQMGVPLEGVEEQRIGYALSAAYLETSGELARLSEQAKNGPQVAQATPEQAAPERPDVVSVQNFLNDVGARGANGKPLTPDGIVGPNTRHAFVTFCEEHGLDPANGVDKEFQAVMASVKSGALTKSELADIQQADAILDDLTTGMSSQQLAAVREQFADVRAAMMGSGNDNQVKEEIGQLVALVQNNAPQQTQQTGRG